MSSDPITAEKAEGEMRDIRDAIVESLLPEVAFDGWTAKALNAAASAAGYPAGTAVRVFPGGIAAVLRHWSDLSDRKMLAAMASRDAATIKVRDRVATAVRMRIELNAAHKEAVRRALSILALPHNAANAAGSTLRAVDAIWYAAGDTSTDLNYYTKRALLTPVYVATVLYWLDDDSDDFAETWAFLDRRLDNVLQIPKATARLRRALNPLSWLPGRLTGTSQASD